LADAFCAAVLCLPDGEFGSREPTVGFRGETEPISTICGMAEYFKSDQIPKNIFLVLCGYMDMGRGEEKLKNDLASDRSYSMAARCLLHLIRRQARGRR
jgi:hypothetical protein